MRHPVENCSIDLTTRMPQSGNRVGGYWSPRASSVYYQEHAVDQTAQHRSVSHVQNRRPIDDDNIS